VEKNPPKKHNKSSRENHSKNIESLVEAYRKAGPYLNIGLVWALAVLFFTWLGIELDKKLNTAPWLTVTGALVGIAAGFYHFIKTVLNENKKNGDSS
jgi:F0F1-type ATP synthase assembly protein I